MPSAPTNRQLFATIAFALLLLAPLIWGFQVEAGDLDAFNVGGLSLEPVFDLEDDAPLNVPRLTSSVDGVAGPSGNPTAQLICEGGGGLTKNLIDSSAANLTTNLTTFGDAYGSLVMDLPGLSVCDDRTVAGLTTDVMNLAFYVEISQADILESEVFRFIAHGEINHTAIGFRVIYQVSETIGIGTVVASHNLVEITQTDYEFGEILEIPLTTQDRLLIEALPDPGAGEANLMRVELFIERVQSPEDGDLVIFDMTTEKTREGALSSTGKLITFNVIYVLVAGFFVVLATPWVNLEDFKTRKGPRRDRRGQGDTIGVLILIAAAIGAIMLFWFFGGAEGGFIGAFTVSFLPLTLAAAGIALVAFVGQGERQRGGVLISAALVGLTLWIVGLSIQSTWIPYDELFVVPFVAVATGQASLTSGFQISAFFVVLVQIAGLLVILFNLGTSLLSDKRVELVQ